MTTPSEPHPGNGNEGIVLTGRLHPWSWLFALFGFLKSFALPLLALLVFGGGRDQQWQFIGAIAGIALALGSVLQYFTYRYGVVDSDLVIRSGILHRNRRHIPLQRIRNVALHRSLLHRLFDVAEVRLESAGGQGAEATMRVLSLPAASELERLIRQGGQFHAEQSAETPDEPPLLALGTGDLIRLGLVSNRGMVVAAAGFATISQLAPNAFKGLTDRWVPVLFGRASAMHLGWLEWALAAVFGVVALLALLRLLSIVLAFVQYHGFELRTDGDRISLERGLLTRLRASAPSRRIQLWTRSESLLQRWLGRQSLAMETSSLGVRGQESTRILEHPAPIARPTQIDTIIGRLLPDADFDSLPWRPLHPGAWKRAVKPPLALTLFACVAAVIALGPLGLLLLGWIPVQFWLTRRDIHARAYALGPRLLAWRTGWLKRSLSFVEIAKLQGVQLLDNPFDRRRGMATLVVDTAGASPLSGCQRIHMRYLPEAEAQALYAEIGRRLAHSPLRW